MVKYPKYYYHFELRKVDERIVTKKKNMKQELKLIKRATKSKLFSLLCFAFLCCSLIWVSLIFGFPFSISYIIFGGSLEEDNTPYDKVVLLEEVGSNPVISSSVSNGTLHCDRSHFRTDVCYMKGDVRTRSSSSSIFLYTSTNPNTSNLHHFPPTLLHQELQHETIRPYTRKWETSIMNTIDELHLISKNYKLPSNSHHKCDVLYDVPAIFFSTGGYTGNVYHEFNDGLIPLYITSHHFNRKVIFVILEYHKWWYTKYGQILSQLSNYPPIDFHGDSRTHCFKEAVVGLKIHNELSIDPSLMQENKSILDFRNLLGRAFEPSLPSPSSSLKKRENHKRKPKVVILSRRGSRSITNEHLLIKLAQKIGFNVQILKPNRKTEMATIYRAISTSDVMIGVHGAAMTHFLFLNPNNVLIQIIPLGTEWASETYYGEPAKKLGLRYIGYNIRPRESSLYNKYGKDNPILRDPNSVNKKGWEYTKKIYLDDQSITLDLKRFRKLLVRAYGDYYSFNSSNIASQSHFVS